MFLRKLSSTSSVAPGCERTYMFMIDNHHCIIHKASSQVVEARGTQCCRTLLIVNFIKRLICLSGSHNILTRLRRDHKLLYLNRGLVGYLWEILSCQTWWCCIHFFFVVCLALYFVTASVIIAHNWTNAPTGHKTVNLFFQNKGITLRLSKEIAEFNKETVEIKQKTVFEVFI